MKKKRRYCAGNRDACIQFCAIPPVKKAEFIRTVDGLSVTMLVDSNMKRHRTGLAGSFDGQPAVRTSDPPVSESLVMDTRNRESGGRHPEEREGAAGAAGSCNGMPVLEEMPVHILNSFT